MSESIKSEISQYIYDFNKYSNSFKENNLPRSLRFILSGKEGIGKTTLIEAIASEYNLNMIHFPKNNYSEKMIHSFFKDVNTILNKNNIIMFDNIDFNIVQKYNPQLYDLLSELIIKNDRNNIFIFTFTSLDAIPTNFTNNFHIHHHYYMEANINNIINFINDNLQGLNQNNSVKLQDIKNKFLKINHKITPGHIIPYLLLNDNFEKSLEQFFKITVK
jgi:SpoVK/Ycf46/Vps4 family AAA+-type ATPase